MIDFRFDKFRSQRLGLLHSSVCHVSVSRFSTLTLLQSLLQYIIVIDSQHIDICFSCCLALQPGNWLLSWIQHLLFYIHKKWTTRWEMDDRFHHSKQFYGWPHRLKAKGIMMLNSSKLKLWVACITGRDNLAYFQNKLNRELDPSCRLCNDAQETFVHLVTDCPAAHLIPFELLQNKMPLPDMT